MSEQRVVAAVGTAVRSDVPGRAEELQRAMAAAVRKALDEGVSIDDTTELIRLQRAARDEILEGE